VAVFTLFVLVQTKCEASVEKYKKKLGQYWKLFLVYFFSWVCV